MELLNQNMIYHPSNGHFLFMERSVDRMVSYKRFVKAIINQYLYVLLPLVTFIFAPVIISDDITMILLL